MAITSDGWLDWAIRVPGPAEKQNTQGNSNEGYIPHSMVGFLNGWYSRLFDMSRRPDGRLTANAAASVTGSILYDGTTIQHYPFGSSCWASGNSVANNRFNAFENEGGPPWNVNEPLTEAQIEANARIIVESSQKYGWNPVRPRTSIDTGASLYEHNEAVRLWGGGATACPSNRIPWSIIQERVRQLLNPVIIVPPEPEPPVPPEEEDMLHLIRTESPTFGAFIWLSDWRVRHYINNPAYLKVMQELKKWPTEVESLRPGSPINAAFQRLPSREQLPMPF